MASDVFINEIHYDNASTDSNEGVEIAGPAGTDLTGWTIQLYNGGNAGVYNASGATEATPLSGTIDDEGTGGGAVNFLIPGIQNGSPDAIALVDNLGVVRQFLSYEGSFTAVGGPADGLTSVDIGVEELGTTPVGQSLQLTGTGTIDTDFTWGGPTTATPGTLNSGQTYVASGSAAIIVTQTNGVTNVVEGGLTDTFSVALSVAPTSNVTVTLSTADGQTSTNVPSLLFTPTNWNQAQTVTVTAVDDAAFEATHTGVIGFSATSSDLAYSGLTASDLTVNIADNDAPPANTSFVINELRVNSGGGAITDFAEIYGDPSTSTLGLYLVFISGEFEPGAIDAVIDLSSGVSDANGFLLATDTSSTVATDPGDVLTAFSVFGSPQTVLLVEGFTGMVGDDLDATNDGVLDSTPWIGVPFDSVSLVDGDQATDFNYSTTVFGPDGNFLPAGVARDVDGTGNYVQLAFGSDAVDTPGSTNSVVTIAATANGEELGSVNGVFTVSQIATKATDTVISYTVGGTATSGSDYTALSGTVTIIAGSLAATINVPVIDDGDTDPAESVILTLTGITSGDASLVLGTTNEATITILDDDLGVILSPGDLVINEIMQNPAAVSDSLGEYFELWNTTGTDININGFIITDLGTESHTISSPSDVIVPANGYLVLAQNANFATNGGVVVGYQYAGVFLANGDDEIIISDSLNNVIDSVSYSSLLGFPSPTGASMELIPGLPSPETANDSGANWQTSTTLIAGSTDFGTPGAVNSTPLPEINVTGSGVSIVDGDTTPDTADGTDFGASVVGVSTPSATFVIENNGTVDLNVSSVTITGLSASDFVVSGFTPGLVSPAGVMTFSVTFTPSTAGAAAATVEIVNDDADESLYDFALTGSGTVTAAPEIDVLGGGLSIADGDSTPNLADATHFGSVDTTVSSQTSTFTIDNSAGSADLNISSISIVGANAADFILNPPFTSGIVAVGTSVTFDVAFDPSSVGSKAATVQIISDDADEGTYDFAIAGLGVNATAETVLINEVDSDTIPNPDADEFIELFGPAGTSLDGLILVFFNGSSDLSYRSLDLDGQVIPADGYFVIGSASVPNVDLVAFTNDALQNGADAVALYTADASSFPIGTAPTTTNLRDVIVYDTSDADDTGLLAGLGETVQFDENGNSSKDTESLQRVPNGLGSSPFVAQTPTPGESNAPVGDTTPPTITDVIISGSSWLPSFRGALGTNGIGLSLPGASQLTSLPWTNLDTISVFFSEDVQKAGGADVDVDDISLGGINTSDYELASGYGLTTSYSDGGTGAGPFVLTISVTGASDFVLDRLALLVSESVQDAAGNLLNGEWTDGVSTVSGNASLGGDFIFHFNVHPGDVNGSGGVFIDDVISVNGRQLQFPGGPNFLARADIDGSASIFINDVLAVNGRQLTFLPGGTAVPPPPAPSALQSGISLSLLADDELSWADGVDQVFANESSLF